MQEGVHDTLPPVGILPGTEWIGDPQVECSYPVQSLRKMEMAFGRPLLNRHVVLFCALCCFCSSIEAYDMLQQQLISEIDFTAMSTKISLKEIKNELSLPLSHLKRLGDAR